MTTEEFIEKARKVHGVKYDYSNTEFVNWKTKIAFVCPKHGEIRQLPYVHLRRKGCPKCSVKKMTKDEFVEKSRKIHGDKYDYTETVYLSALEPVTIRCPKHGYFTLRAENHYLKSIGYGCPRCGGRIVTTDDFIERANIIHNNKYGYALTKFNGMKSNVTVTCQKHGNFEIVAMRHLRGIGCPQCNVRSTDTESFIKKARMRHGDMYDYSKVDYKGSHVKVCIVCPEHGEFWQNPHNHINGSHCPECARHRHARKVGFDEFVRRARQVHGNKYAYNRDSFDGVANPTVITCPKHGDFLMKPYVHIRNCGCKECYRESKPTRYRIYKKKEMHSGQINDI